MPEGTHAVVHGVAGLDPGHGRLLFAVGAFDGIHRGHLYLLGELRRAAHRLHARPAVVTFDAHPDELLVGAAPALVCDPDERLVRLDGAGVAVTVVQPFDDELRQTTYESFVRAIRDRVDLAGFVMTPDAAFGHLRAGTPEALAELGDREGFAVVVVPALDLGGRPVRSSEIRAAVAAGDLDEAVRLLGRPYAVVGRRGAGTGGVGEPGAIALSFDLPVALPPAGEYRVTIEAAWAPGSSGRRAAVRGRASVEPGRGIWVRAAHAPPPAARLRVAFAEPRA
ncbi:MAG: FAD synthetase family protein [Chloroflexi bacterium]|nr:FAD synthetase family protein [Chloroflexota bacterium]